MSIENKDWHIANHVKKAKDLRRVIKDKYDEREAKKLIHEHRHR